MAGRADQERGKAWRERAGGTFSHLITILGSSPTVCNHLVTVQMTGRLKRGLLAQ